MAVRRFRSEALTQASRIARGYRPYWWQQFVITQQEAAVYGVDIRTARVFGVVRYPRGITPIAACVAPSIPGSIARFPQDDSAIPFWLFVLDSRGALTVYTIDTLAPIGFYDISASTTAGWLAPGRSGILVPGRARAEILMWDQTQNRVTDRRRVSMSDAQFAVWVDNDTYDLYAILDGYGRGTLLTYDAPRKRLTSERGRVLAGREATLVDPVGAALFPVGADAWPYYRTPTQLATMSNGPLARGQISYINIEDPFTPFADGADRRFADFVITDTAGAFDSRRGTRLDAGQFPQLPWFKGVTRLAPADPGLDRRASALVISGAQNEATVISDDLIPDISFVLYTAPQGYWKHIVTADEAGTTNFTTTIPWTDEIYRFRTPTLYQAAVLINGGPGVGAPRRNIIFVANDNNRLRFGISASPALVEGDCIELFMGLLENTPNEIDLYTFFAHTSAGYHRERAVAGKMVYQTNIPWQPYYVNQNSTMFPDWLKPTVSVSVNNRHLPNSLMYPYVGTDGKEYLGVTLVGWTPVTDDVVYIIPTRIQQDYTVPGDEPGKEVTVRIRLRGYFERKAYPAESLSGERTPIPLVLGVPPQDPLPPGVTDMTPVIRMSKTTSMIANTIDTVTVTSRDHNYRWLLNGRRGQGEFPGTDDPYFSGFDLVVDLNPCYVGDVLSFAYEMRPATSTRVATAVPIYEREKYIPADDDGGKPLLAFDPLAPINGVAGQIDILEVF